MVINNSMYLKLWILGCHIVKQNQKVKWSLYPLYNEFAGPFSASLQMRASQLLLEMSSG